MDAKIIYKVGLNRRAGYATACRKGYLNKYLRYDLKIFLKYSTEPGLCDKLAELNSVYVL